uniref:Integrase catalytic domain-containing protein n=1 Tax=Heliothis virescens TaxID=7102 RepID=A0A2A4JMN7_HELVI
MHHDDNVEDRGIRHILNAVASPRANGQVERYNRTVLNSLTAQTQLNFDERNWDDKVGKVQWGMNNTRQKTTGRTPAEVMFGLKMNSEIRPMLNELVQESNEELDTELLRESVKDRIEIEQENQISAHDENRRPARVYGEGDLVKITRTSFANDGKSKKQIPPYVGPYRVIEVLRNDRYRLAAIPGLSSTKSKRRTTVAADCMLPWVHVAALDVNKDNDNDDEDASSCDDEDIDE